MSSDCRLTLSRADKRKIGQYIRQQFQGVRRVKFNGDGTISMFIVKPITSPVLCGYSAFGGDWVFAGWQENYYYLLG